MATDTSEKGLETLIVRYMTGTDGLPPVALLGTGSGPNADVAARPASAFGGTGYFAGSSKDYDRAHALGVYQLFAFLKATQPDAFKKLAMLDEQDARDINRLKFLTRLSSEIGKRGVIDVLRKGIAHHPAGHFDLFYGAPSEGNAKAQAQHALNRFGATRQFAYSVDEKRRALDLGLFINGLPIATFELKNSLTNILENYAQILEAKNPKTGKVKRGQLFPRYHQLAVVRHLPEPAGCPAAIAQGR